MNCRNGIPIRKQADKPGPSGASRNTAYALPERWGGCDWLIPVDKQLVRQMKERLGGDAIIAFNTPEFSELAQAAYDSLGVVKLDFHNVWDIYQAMLNVLYE